MKGKAMRTNIEIDDKLMKKALKLSGAPTKRAVVEEALQTFIRLKAQEEIGKWFGKLRWEGDLEWSRSKDKWAEAEDRKKTTKRAAGTSRRSAA